MDRLEEGMIGHLHDLDDKLLDYLFTLIKTETPSNQRLILLDYIEVRHQRIIAWTAETS